MTKRQPWVARFVLLHDVVASASVAILMIAGRFRLPMISEDVDFWLRLPLSVAVVGSGHLLISRICNTPAPWSGVAGSAIFLALMMRWRPVATGVPGHHSYMIGVLIPVDAGIASLLGAAVAWVAAKQVFRAEGRNRTESDGSEADAT